MCKINASVIAADGRAIQAACNSIAAIERADNPALADKIVAAAQVVADLTANFQTGTAAQDLNTAGLALQDVLALVPMTSPYAPFVGIAVAALDVILANVATQPAQAALPPTTQKLAHALVIRAHIQSMPDNPYRGLVRIHRMPWEGPRTALVNAWNKEVEATPEIGIARL
jgi:hypothetical protein